MQLARYKVWAWGDPIHGSTAGATHVGIAGVAKVYSESKMYAIANEFICAELGRYIRLPIPPWVLVDKGGKPCFVSLNFNLAGETLPPVIPSDFVQEYSYISCGIIMFDMWLANGDRNECNIACYDATKEVHVFDHEAALLRGNSGTTYLNSLNGQFGLDDHCLVPHIRNLQSCYDWHNKIESIPDHFISAIVNESKKCGLDPDLVKPCEQFLLSRRESLIDVLNDNMDKFSSLEA
jgi:hypothetical protein